MHSSRDTLKIPHSSYITVEKGGAKKRGQLNVVAVDQGQYQKNTSNTPTSPTRVMRGALGGLALVLMSRINRARNERTSATANP